MNREDIIRMARDAGLTEIVRQHDDGTVTLEVPHLPRVLMFAALVAAAEREECAKVAEPQTWVCPDSPAHRYNKPGHCEDCGKTLVQVVEPEQPVAWQINDGTSIYVTDMPVDAEEAAEEGWVRTPLYTAPPSRKPLTDEELEVLWDEATNRMEHFCSQYWDFARAIERAHGIGGDA